MTVCLILQGRFSEAADAKFLAPHYVEDEELAELVLKDLGARYPDQPAEISKIKPECLFYDLGGSIRGTWKADLAGPVGFWPHQADSFLSTMNRKLNSEVRELNGARYCKLGTHQGMVCIRESTLLAARADLLARWDAISAQRDADLGSWDDAMAAMRAAPHPGILLPDPIDMKNAN